MYEDVVGERLVNINQLARWDDETHIPYRRKTAMSFHTGNGTCTHMHALVRSENVWHRARLKHVSDAPRPRTLAADIDEVLVAEEHPHVLICGTHTRRTLTKCGRL